MESLSISISISLSLSLTKIAGKNRKTAEKKREKYDRRESEIKQGKGRRKSI